MNPERPIFPELPENPDEPEVPDSPENSELTPEEPIISEPIDKTKTEAQTTEEQQIEKVKAFDGFWSGFREEARRDLSVEKFKNKFEGLKQAAAAIRHNPALLGKFVVPILAAGGVRLAARYVLKQAAGVPGWIAAISVGAVAGAIMTGRAQFLEQKKSTEPKPETQTEKAQALTEALEPIVEEKVSERKTNWRKICGAATYGAVRGGVIAGVSWWAFSGFPGLHHEAAPSSESIPEIPKSENFAYESANFSGGEVDPHQALTNALDKPDLHNLVDTLTHPESHGQVSLEGIDHSQLALDQVDSAGQSIAEKISDNNLSIDQYLYAHGIDAGLQLENGQTLNETVKDLFTTTNLGEQNADVQEKVLYEILSYPELLNHEGAVDNLIINASTNPSGFVDFVHGHDFVQEGYVQHTGNAILERRFDTNHLVPAIEQLQDYATVQHAEGGSNWHWDNITDNKEKIEQLLNWNLGGAAGSAAQELKLSHWWFTGPAAGGAGLFGIWALVRYGGKGAELLGRLSALKEKTKTQTEKTDKTNKNTQEKTLDTNQATIQKESQTREPEYVSSANQAQTEKLSGELGERSNLTFEIEVDDEGKIKVNAGGYEKLYIAPSSEQKFNSGKYQISGLHVESVSDPKDPEKKLWAVRFAQFKKLGKGNLGEPEENPGLKELKENSPGLEEFDPDK